MADATKVTAGEKIRQLKDEFKVKVNAMKTKQEATVTKIKERHDKVLAAAAAKTAKQCNGMLDALKKIDGLALDIDRAEAITDPAKSAKAMVALAKKIRAAAGKYVV